MVTGSVPRSRGVRWGRVLGAASSIALGVFILLLLPPLVSMLPRPIRREMTEGFLRGFLIVYAAILAGALPGAALLGWVGYRSWREGVRRPIVARLCLFCVASFVGLLLVEASAVAWGAWAHRMPALPTRFADAPAGEVSLVVIGGSSALGEPFCPRISIGQILGWQLERVLPGRRFRVDILASLGASLEEMHQKLAGLTRRPDAMIIYSGHNEFVARYEPERSLSLDESPPNPLLDRLYQASLTSPFCRLVYEIVNKNRLDGPPGLVHTHHLIDPPQCSPSERAEVFADFGRRLEAIVSYCERVGCVPILIIPPGNDGGFEPNRSVLPPTVSPGERRRVEAEFRAAHALESSDPSRATALLRALLDRHPGFSEAHFRLARLRERAGAYDEANRHYILARDHDGLTLRCHSAIERIYRDVATRHGCILIDGPEVLRALSPHGILDDHIIQDAHHPTVLGQVGLAQAVLHALHARRALGWRGGEVPTLDPEACVAHFGVDAETWIEACKRTDRHYRRIATARYDPTARLSRADGYARAAREIAAGKPPEETGVTGLGLESAQLKRFRDAVREGPFRGK